MKVIENEQLKFFDVDDTLVMPNDGTGTTVEVYDAVTNKFITMKVHKPMVRLLREEHHRGSYVVVWSRSGYEWAANVIKALDLVSYVHLVCSKPFAYFDDKDIAEWLPYRVYLQPDMKYKRN